MESGMLAWDKGEGDRQWGAMAVEAEGLVWDKGMGVVQ